MDVIKRKKLRLSFQIQAVLWIFWPCYARHFAAYIYNIAYGGKKQEEEKEKSLGLESGFLDFNWAGSGDIDFNIL